VWTWLAAAWRRFLAEFEYSAILVGAGTIAALSLLDVISEVKPLIASVLAILSLMAFAVLRQSSRRELEIGKIDNMRASIQRLADRIDELETSQRSSQAIVAIQGGVGRSAVFSEALSDPLLWHFRGSMGGYLRARTLKSISEATRRRAGTRALVTVQVLDPANLVACSEYATYRRRLEEQRGSPRAAEWTTERVRLECFASVLAAGWYYQHERLDIRLGLLDRVSTLRFDVSENAALVTNEDRKFPVLVIRKSSPMYFAVVRDLEASLEHSRRVYFEQSPELPRDHSQLDVTAIEALAASAGIARDIVSSATLPGLLKNAFDHDDDYSAST